MTPYANVLLSIVFFSRFFSDSQTQWSLQARPRDVRTRSADPICVPSSSALNGGRAAVIMGAQDWSVDADATSESGDLVLHNTAGGVQRLSLPKRGVNSGVNPGTSAEAARRRKAGAPLSHRLAAVRSSYQRPTINLRMTCAQATTSYRLSKKIAMQPGGLHQQRRAFRDYFTAQLPGSSLHPDAAPHRIRKTCVPPRGIMRQLYIVC